LRITTGSPIFSRPNLSSKSKIVPASPVYFNGFPFSALIVLSSEVNFIHFELNIAYLGTNTIHALFGKHPLS